MRSDSQGKNMRFIFAFMIVLQAGYADLLQQTASLYSKQIQARPTSGFDSLSPALTDAITESFYLLHECYPNHLENGAYLEFGIYKGYSLWFAQQVGNYFAPHLQYFGFDSFEGLPSISADYRRGDWSPGLYKADYEYVKSTLSRNHADFNRLHLIKGWFSQPLFQQSLAAFKDLKISILTIDSDTYESCREILGFWFPLVKPGTIILFDEFLGFADTTQNQFSERRALIEWCAKHPEFLLKPLFPFSWHGYAFIVLQNQDETLPNEVVQKLDRFIAERPAPANFSISSIR